MKKVLFLSVIIFASLKSQCQYTTTLLAPIPERVANNAVCGAVINSQEYVYTFGGIDSSKTHSGIHNRCYKYDVGAANWLALPDLPSSPTRIAAGATVIDSIAYIIGGYHVFANGSEQSSNLVHRLDLNADTFLVNGANLPKATDDHIQCAYKDSLIFIVTGWSQTANIPDVQIYNPALDTWLIGTSVPNTHYYKSFGASGTILGDTLYYFGGARMGNNFPITNLIRKGYINPDSITDIEWTIDTISTSLVGYRMASTKVDDKLLWIGGSDQTYNYNGIAYQGNVPVEPNNRVLEYWPKNNSWDTSFHSMINMDLRGIASFNCNLYLVGGMASNQKVSEACVKISCKPSSIENKVEVINLAYPNPCSSILFFKTHKKNGFESLKIYSNTGVLVYEDYSNTHPYSINVSEFAKGIYYLQTKGDNSISTQKIIIQ